MPEAKRGRGRPPVDDPAEDLIRFRVTPEDKERYFRAAAKAGKALSAWIKGVLDRAAKRVK